MTDGFEIQIHSYSEEFFIIIERNAQLYRRRRVVGVFFSFRFLFSTPHREEVLQLSCVYGASQEYQLVVPMTVRRIICSSGSRPSREFSNIERYQQQWFSEAGREKLEKEVPSLTQPLQKKKEKKRSIITLEYAQE